MGNTLDTFNVRRGVKRRRTEENSPDSINAAEQCDHPSLEHTPKRLSCITVLYIYRRQCRPIIVLYLILNMTYF